jgi:aspartyl aminopeptidase
MSEGDSETKSTGQELSEKLAHEPKNAWETISDSERKSVFELAEEYKAMLDRGKTEREFTAACVEILDAEGYRDLDALLCEEAELKPGMKVYQVIRGKSLLFAVIGKNPVERGLNIVGAHVDSPRVDLKTKPLYEESGLAMFDTQYYGGIKKYQWMTIPLALHGVAIKANGEKVQFRIGEDDGDPVFTITDLLPHLARAQMEMKASEFINGEMLNALAGSIPFKDSKAENRVKLNILSLLNEKYGMDEQDFSSAELELVPAAKARDVGLDRSMIGGYGHDDRCCAFAAVKAVLGIGADGAVPDRTCVCILTDKEEIGSCGNTGAQSRIFENFVAYLCHLSNKSYTDIALRQCLTNSSMLSADVSPASDANFPDVLDKNNGARFGFGVVLTKYTGWGGKTGGSDASAEFFNKVRAILGNAKVQWQHGGFGKVDQGGGGTIAVYVANLGVEVLDCGIPVLSMHAPFEVISKMDLYMTLKAYLAFLRNA